jgi:hypothetical protein
MLHHTTSALEAAVVWGPGSRNYRVISTSLHPHLVGGGRRNGRQTGGHECTEASPAPIIILRRRVRGQGVGVGMTVRLGRLCWMWL